MEFIENNGLLSNFEDSPFISDEQLSMIKSSLFATRKWIQFLSIIGGIGILIMLFVVFAKLIYSEPLPFFVPEFIQNFGSFFILVSSSFINVFLFKHSLYLKRFEHDNDPNHLLSAFEFYAKFWKFGFIFFMFHIGFMILFFITSLFFLAK